MPVKLFISHRDEYKRAAHELAQCLEPFGVSPFIAHDAIGPMALWQEEILRNLNEMDILLVFITDDFHESDWTNQEVGYALGRNIPVIPLRLQQATTAKHFFI